MTIQSQDIKIFASDTMSDADEGGGAITGNEVVGGLSNNIFEDISTLDRTYGAVHLRKVFPAIYTQTQDQFFGSHVLISKLPGDTKLGVNLFSTGDWFDRRPEAQSRIENYRAKGANYTGFLFATQYRDSKVVTIFQSETAPIPGVGEVLYLHQFSETENQFIKIVSMDDRVQEFTDQQGTFRRRILECEISEPLKFDFVGAQISRYDTLNPQAKIKSTIVANAAKYYSARPMDNAAEIGDTQISVDTVYSQVIPSSLQELAITDADTNGVAIPLADSSNGEVTLSISNNFGPNLSFYAGGPILPGSFSFTSGGSTIVDEGGNLKSGNTTVGTINYIEGTWTFLASSPTYTGTKDVTFKAAAAPTQVARTGTEAITDASRGLIYAYTMDPLPLPGSVLVSYRALGEWYNIYDDGNGKLEGLETGIGTGTINYSTGTLSITLASLPDEGSQIIYSWGTPARYENRANQTPDPLNFTINLAHDGIAPSTLTIGWVGADTTQKTATADAFGVISGDASGEINHADGTITLMPDDMPLGGTEFSIDYQYGPPESKSWSNPSKSGGVLNLDLGFTNITPNTLRLEWNTEADGYEWTGLYRHYSRAAASGNQYAKDDGNGNIRRVGGGTIGTINYTTGIISFNPDVTVTANAPVFRRVKNGTRISRYGLFTGQPIRTTVYAWPQVGFKEQNVPTYFPSDGGGFVNAKFMSAGSDTSESTTVTLSQMQVDLTDGFDETILPGSVRFRLSGKWYTDPSANGQLFTDIDPTSGVGVFSGTVDYGTGVCSLTSWADGPNSLTLRSLMTEKGRIPIDVVTFRVPNAPVRVGSLQIRATKVDGTLLTATSDEQGDILGTDIIGFIEYQTGVVTVQFGTEVTAAGNEGEDWYDPNAVDEEGNIVKPAHVLAETMLYNAVSQTFLPLSSDILGLDPVRLPQDGRIPVFYDGDVVVVLHDNETTGTYSNGQTVTLRPRLSKITVRDAGGSDLLEGTYSADLDLGEITFNDLSGISQPITITDRIEDMALLTDVQITGRLTLSQPLSHDFPAGETLVSNAVISGDLYARTSIPFDQQTWTGEWSDTQIGNDVAAQFNNSQYPITVDNASAIEERWALIFNGSNTVNVIGENVGQILSSAAITSDIAPINPNTGQPYFTIPAAGWGSGWSTGNVLRFNTKGANSPIWIIQSVGQGPAEDEDLSFTLEFRGDIDTP